MMDELYWPENEVSLFLKSGLEQSAFTQLMMPFSNRRNHRLSSKTRHQTMLLCAAIARLDGVQRGSALVLSCVRNPLPPEPAASVGSWAANITEVQPQA